MCGILIATRPKHIVAKKIDARLADNNLITHIRGWSVFPVDVTVDRVGGTYAKCFRLFLNDVVAGYLF